MRSHANRNWASTPLAGIACAVVLGVACSSAISQTGGPARDSRLPAAAHRSDGAAHQDSSLPRRSARATEATPAPASGESVAEVELAVRPQAEKRDAVLTAAVGEPPPPAPAEASDPRAEPGVAMTLADVLQTALQNHPLLRVRQHEVELARAALITAGLLPNPQLVMNTGTDLDRAGETDLTSRVTITIPTGPKRRLRTSVAQSALQESEWALSYEIKRVLADADDAAVEVLYSQEYAALCRRLRELAGRMTEIQKDRFKIGAVPYRGVVQSELALADSQLAERGALARLKVAQIRLAQAMGSSTTTASPPRLQGQLQAETLSLVPLDEILAEARCVAPELARSQTAVSQAQQQLALERWKALPDLTIGPRFRDSFSDRSSNLGARVEVDLPLFDRNQGGIAAGAAQLQTNCARLELAEITTLADVAALYLDLQATQEDLRFYQAEVTPRLKHTEAALDEAFQDRAIAAYEMVSLLQQIGQMHKNDLDLRLRSNRLRGRLEILLERRLGDSPPIVPAGPAGQ